MRPPAAPVNGEGRTLLACAGFSAQESRNFEGGHALYELDRGDHHYHMVDMSSGQITEFESPEIVALLNKIAGEHGYVLDEHSLVLYVRKQR